MKSHSKLSLYTLICVSVLVILSISSCNNPKSSGSPVDILAADSTQTGQPEHQESHQNKQFHLDMPAEIKKTKAVFLSDLARSIQYVPLETTPKYMIGEKTAVVRPCAEYIFIAEHGKPIGVFDLKGKFVRTIGLIGRGPAEYNFDYTFWPDATTRKVYVANTNVKGISSYSFEGDHTGDIIPEVHSMSFVPLGNGTFLSWTFRQQEFEGQFFRLFFHDDQGRILKRVFEPEKVYDFSSTYNSILSPLLTYAPDGVLYNSWEDDQICKAKADFTFEPVLTWDPGHLKMPKGPKMDYQQFQREMVKYLIDQNAWESRQNWLIQYHYKSQLQLAVLEKDSGEFYLVSNPDHDQEGVVNNLDGGPSFWPSWYSDQGMRFFRLVQAVELINGDLKQPRDLQIRDPLASDAFRSMVATLNENSNPVVMIVEMK